MSPSDDVIHCSLCGRPIPRKLITRHHLLPKSRGGKSDDTVPMCRACHKQLHALFDNHILAREMNDLKSLRESPALQKFVKWVTSKDYVKMVGDS